LRVNTSQMEFIWRSSPSLGVAAQSFTGLLYSGYGPFDATFCWDQSCNSGIPIQVCSWQRWQWERARRAPCRGWLTRVLALGRIAAAPAPHCPPPRPLVRVRQDDTDLHDYNVDERIATFLNGTLTQAQAYRGNHIMLTMGSDFQVRRPGGLMGPQRHIDTLPPSSSHGSMRTRTPGTRIWISVSPVPRCIPWWCGTTSRTVTPRPIPP
jgi:hypothetical protein